MLATQKASLWISRFVIWVTIVLSLYPAIWILIASFSGDKAFQ